MEIKTIIKTSEVDIGSKLILVDGRKAIVDGIVDSMLPTIDYIYWFTTDLGLISPEQVKQIIKEGE